MFIALSATEEPESCMPWPDSVQEKCRPPKKKHLYTARTMRGFVPPVVNSMSPPNILTVKVRYYGVAPNGQISMKSRLTALFAVYGIKKRFRETTLHLELRIVYKHNANP